MEKPETSTQEKSLEEQNEAILKAMDRLQKEVWYNRVAMSVFLVVALFYINFKASHLGDILGTFIQMFMQ